MIHPVLPLTLKGGENGVFTGFFGIIYNILYIEPGGCVVFKHRRA
jgi:hypothetical protein